MDTKSTKKTTINSEFRNGTHLKFRASTGFAINTEKDWDFSKQKMKLPSKTVNAKLIILSYLNLIFSLLTCSIE